MPAKQEPEKKQGRTATLSALQPKQHLSNEVYDKIAAVHNSSVGHWGHAKCKLKLNDPSVSDRMISTFIRLPGDEPPEGPNQDAPLHLRLLQSIRGDPPGPHRPIETRCPRQHVHPGPDRRVLKVGRVIPHQDNDGIGVSFVHIPAYGTLQHTRGRSHRPWNSFS